jgi:hypothetical protein
MAISERQLVRRMKGGARVIAYANSNPMKDQKPIDVSVISPGKALVTVRKSAYPQVARHWEEQLTGPNRKKWGKIYTDPSTAAIDERRKGAMGVHGPSMSKGLHVNRDECPGAMFIWETQETADVEELCAADNQIFGTQLYQALHQTLISLQKYPPREGNRRLGWWEVEFKFLP